MSVRLYDYPVTFPAAPTGLPAVLVTITFKLLPAEATPEVIEKLKLKAQECVIMAEPPIYDATILTSWHDSVSERIKKAIRQEVVELAYRLKITHFILDVDLVQPRDAIALGIESGKDGLNVATALEKPHFYFLPHEVRTRHVYIAGKTQSGKSSLMFNCVIQDIGQGKAGVAVIDPHGDLVERIAGHIAPHRADAVIYLDATDPVPIDFMSYANEREKEALVGDIIFVLQRFAGWGPRMDSILRNLLYTLLEAGDVCFLDIYHFLVNDVRRAEILARVTDDDLLRYWRESFPKPDAIEPILSRMTAFVRSPSLKVFLGSSKAQLNLYDVMQEGKIILVNLVKFGRESGDLFGSLLVAKIQQAAMRRHDIPPEKRRPFYLYTDEFERFQTSAFDIILSEAGKFKLGLVMANQFVDQLDPKILSSVLGNVATFILFRMDEKDARHFTSSITTWDADTYFTRRLQSPNTPFREAEKFGNVSMPPTELAYLPPGTALYKPERGQAVFISFTNNAVIPNAESAESHKKRTVDSFSCYTEPPVVQLKHDDDIQPTGRPQDVPSEQD